MDIHPTSFSQLFSRGYYENLLDLSDCCLRTEDGCVFQVHRFLLARENRYFRAMFCGIGKNRRDFLIPGIRGEILDNVLTYIYNGIVHLTDSNVCELLVASDYLLADSLTSQIKNYTKSHMDADNCIPIYMTALDINLHDIQRWGYRYIQTHFGTIVHRKTAKFGDISFSALKRFLSDKNLCVRSEREAWFSIVKWVERDAPSRLRYVPDLMQGLMVSDMDESLAKDIFSSEIVANNPFCEGLNEIKKEGFMNGLDAFLEGRSKISAAPPDMLPNRRAPERLHLVADYYDQTGGEDGGVRVYVTYDENLDLWRKIGETPFYPTYVMAVDYDVYAFDTYGESFAAFNLIEKQWREIVNMPTPRAFYQLVTLWNMLYVIGGESVETGSELLNVEYYNPDLNMWFQAAPMFPVAFYSSAVLQDRIFVVGKLPEHLMEFGMIAQVYNVDTNSWTVCPAPNVYRFNFTLTAYHGKLYIIGGSNDRKLLESVEVFDFEQNMWQVMKDLPCAYWYPQAVVLNEKLIVFESVCEDQYNFKKNPPVFWNEAATAWEVVDTFLPFNLEQYLFCTIDDSEKIGTILRENRDPAAQFEKSPFASI